MEQSKYQGHTPGPWDIWHTLNGDVLRQRAEPSAPSQQLAFIGIHANAADRALIADAPALLARAERAEAALRVALLDHKCGTPTCGCAVCDGYCDVLAQAESKGGAG